MTYAVATYTGQTITKYAAGTFDEIDQFAYQNYGAPMVGGIAATCPRCAEPALIAQDDDYPKPRWLFVDAQGRQGDVACLDCGYVGLCVCGSPADVDGYCCTDCRKGDTL